MSTDKARPTVSKTELARLRERAAETRAKLAHKPSIPELLSPEELADAAPFYFALRACIAELKKTREAAGLTLVQVAEKTGLAVETLSRLETGQVTNPTWKTLGLYAAAVNCQLFLQAVTEENAAMNDQNAGQEFLKEQWRAGRQYTIGAETGKTVALDVRDDAGRRPMNPVAFRQELSAFLQRVGYPRARVGAVEAAIFRLCREATPTV